jgi:hypothetical protein
MRSCQPVRKPIPMNFIENKDYRIGFQTNNNAHHPGPEKRRKDCRSNIKVKAEDGSCRPEKQYNKGAFENHKEGQCD